MGIGPIAMGNKYNIIDESVGGKARGKEATRKTKT
jgi:hypothetical protein